MSPPRSESGEPDGERRKRLGAWYTPEWLVDAVCRAVVASAIESVPVGGVVSVLDPACGDGRFLAAAGELVGSSGRIPRLVGVDVDPDAVRAARRSLLETAVIVRSDALTRRWGADRFDVVIGNPPYLSQLAAATSRGGTSAHGGGPYADAAVEFLALAFARVVDGGRIGLVLPLSILATRDAGPVRERVLAQATPTWFWWSPRPVFDAQVRTCAIGFVRSSGRPTVVERRCGPSLAPVSPLATAELVSTSARTGSWSVLVTDRRRPAPTPRARARDGVLGDRATVTADFRDEYYGLVGAVSDEGAGPPLVTSGLIDPGSCAWGVRSTRFAKRRFAAPRVDLDALAPRMAEWAASRLRPKVLVANQTRVLEAVADDAGSWLPSVPVVSVIPGDPDDVGLVAALLTSPVATSWLAGRVAGAGLSAHALRVSAPVLAGLPWPARSLSAAADELAAGDPLACGARVCEAFGMGSRSSREELARWGPLVSAARERSG